MTSSASYSKRMMGLATLSAMLALGVAYLNRAGLVPSGLRPVAALVPVLPLVGFFVGVARWLRTLDEMQRLIHHEALMVQFGATGILIMGYGMLAKFGVVPNVTAGTAYPFLWLAIFGFWYAGLLIVRRKYR